MRAALRVSEVTALSTGDLALDLGRVQVRGKGDKERIVPLGRTPRFLRFGRVSAEWTAASGAH
jgi:integrase/recombinase XerD